jgi:hypothetical protein
VAIVNILASFPAVELAIVLIRILCTKGPLTTTTAPLGSLISRDHGSLLPRHAATNTCMYIQRSTLVPGPRCWKRRIEGTETTDQLLTSATRPRTQTCIHMNEERHEQTRHSPTMIHLSCVARCVFTSATVIRVSRHGQPNGITWSNQSRIS